MTLSKEYTEEDINDLNQKSLQLQNILLDNSELNEESTEEIITILVTTTNEERQLIRAEYKKQNNHPIQDDINAKLKENYSNFNDMFINMFDTPYEYDAKELYKVLSSKDSNEDTIIEIFSTRSKSYLDIIDIAYKKFFNISLRDEIKKQFHKIFADFLLAIMDNERPLEQTISGDDAYEIANEIRKDWKNVGFEAKPYLDAMASLTSITDMYGWDSAKNVVVFFLDNSDKWKGETADRIKQELKELIEV